MQFRLPATSTLTANKPDIRGLLNRVRLGPLAIKVGVILAFTTCWLIVAVVRINNTAHGSVSLDGSSLIGLAGSAEQRQISGRDFQSVFGPGTQMLAFTAMSVAKTDSPLRAYGMITFFFCGASAILLAVTLLLCDRLTWKDCAVVYLFCFFLNLFFDVLDFRTAMLMATVALAYRIIAAETTRQLMMWSTLTGFACFYAQLVTFELGIYAAVVVIGAVIAGSIFTRNTDVLLAIEVIVATIAAANLELVAFFKWTSSSYGMVFDYQNYALEIIRALHNNAGMVWQLSTGHTVALGLVMLYVIGASVVFMVSRSDPLDASLFAAFLLLSLIWLNTASVKSDVPHIMVAFTPMVLLLALLATRVWNSRHTGFVWVAAVGALLFAWPLLNAGAAEDLVQIASGRLQARTALRTLYNGPVKTSQVPGWLVAEAADFGNIPVLSFPSDSQIGAGMRHASFAPVLENYAASSDALEKYYLQALTRQPPRSLAVVYGPDRELASPAEDVQPITRRPDVFEYLYARFELGHGQDHTDGHYLLHEREQVRNPAREPLAFAASHELADRALLKLAAPTTCGLVRLQLRAEYGKNTFIFRPSGIELTLDDGDQHVWQGEIQPFEPNHTFATYVSPLPPGTFHKVFGEGPIQSVKWDRLEYRALPTDILGTKADHVRIESIQCLDPQKFVEASPSSSRG